MSLYGLVICGGRSTRMGTDKSRLVYYKKPQHEHVADLLAPLCEQVILCCNEEQQATFQSNYELLTDSPAFTDAGPMTGLLSAYVRFPGNDFLVAGCDYPYLTTDALATFLRAIDKDLPANAFYNRDGMYEPLLGWYAGSAGNALLEAYQNGSHSLQRFLRAHDAGQYSPPDEKTMISVDTNERFQAVKKELEEDYGHEFDH